MSVPKVHTVTAAMAALNEGKRLYYTNNSTKRAELTNIGHKWAFVYCYDGIIGPAKFARDTAKESIEAYLRSKAYPRRDMFLYVDRPLPRSKDGDVNRVEIHVPRGTIVTVIEF